MYAEFPPEIPVLLEKEELDELLDIELEVVQTPPMSCAAQVKVAVVVDVVLDELVEAGLAVVVVELVVEMGASVISKLDPSADRDPMTVPGICQVTKEKPVVLASFPNVTQ